MENRERRPVKNGMEPEADTVAGTSLERNQEARRANAAGLDYMAVFDQLSVGVGLCDIKGELIAANRAFLDILGVKDIIKIREAGFLDYIAVSDDLRDKLLQGETIETPIGPGLRGNRPSAGPRMERTATARLECVISPINTGDGNLGGFMAQIQESAPRRRRREKAPQPSGAEPEKEVEQSAAELREKVRHLEELNTALKVLLRHRDEDRRGLEESVLSNIRSLIRPYMVRLKQSGLSSEQKTYLAILESHIDEITSPFMQKLSKELQDFTPMEVQVAGLIREGKKTKEIADLLHLSKNTVIFHRYNIRTKLKLKNQKKNLRSFLQSVQ
jgi:DNA-binding CsgD family transcriptional regulator